MTVCQLLSVFRNDSLDYYLLVFMNIVNTTQLGSTYLSEFHLMLTTGLLCCFVCVSDEKLIKPYQCFVYIGLY